ncbi:TPA: hypothetical protein N0F65_002394 [Lagenidium giganteum]|uniref:DEP domain-containing protein n=1 Tax=Lagenidium giganteum TaxID=4803 RepID=A0AAV2YI82_9STRA|nr:TPA: hypothetical protein N0F65_002394 [Lagenidium giganteum]
MQIRRMTLEGERVSGLVRSSGPPQRVREASVGQTEQDDVMTRLAARMKQNIATGDRRRHLFKKYSNCFTGMEAVDWMLEHMEAKSVQEALRKGETLLEMQFIEKVDKEIKFEYSKKRFYRFTPTTPDLVVVARECPMPNAALEIPLSAASRRRALAALIGAFVADAASTSLNGVSHPEKAIPNLLRSDFDPAFCGLFDSATDIYTCSTKRSGEQRMESSTGFEARVILQCIAHRGEVNGAQLAKDAYWGFKNNPRLLSATSRAFIKRIQSGKNWPNCAVRCKSIDILSVIPAVVALYAGTDILFEKVNEFVRVFYIGNSVRDAALVAAFILEQVILGSSVLEALRMSIRTERLTVRQRKVIFKAFTKSELPSYQAIQKFGNKGALPGGFRAVLQPLFVLSDYPTAVRENIIGGGRTCRRAMFLGACFGAMGGLDAIPETWVKKTPYYDFIESDALAILSRREIQGSFFEDEDTRESTPYIDYSPTNPLSASRARSSHGLRSSGSTVRASGRVSLNRCQANSCETAVSTPRSCASNLSYGSATTTASSCRSVVDLGEMSKYYQAQAPPDSGAEQLASDMVQFFHDHSTATATPRKSDLLVRRSSDVIIPRVSGLGLDQQQRGSIHAIL